MKIRNVICLAVAVLPLVSACSSNIWNVQHVAYSGTGFPAKAANAPITIFEGNANRPHTSIAKITVNPRNFHAPSFLPKSTERAMAKLKERARELGADAIKNVRLHVAPSGTVGAGNASVSGTAIRWK